MIIGQFSAQDDGSYIGNIYCSEWRDLLINIFPDGTKEEGTDAPDFVITAREGINGEGVEIGAAWARTSKAGNEYLSVTLDSPTFPAPLACMFVHQPDHYYGLIWQRGASDANEPA